MRAAFARLWTHAQRRSCPLQQGRGTIIGGGVFRDRLPFSRGRTGGNVLCCINRRGGFVSRGWPGREGGMSLGLILIILVILYLFGGLSGRFGGYGYGLGHSGIGLGGVILVVLLVLVLLGKI